MKNKVGRPRFFQKIFLPAVIKFEVILKILFMKLSNADVLFNEKTLMRKTYIINKALTTMKQVQIIGKKNFVIAVIDADIKTFVIYMAIWEEEKMPVHSQKQAQVKVLIFDKAPTVILAEYSHYSNFFLVEYATKLLEHTGINNYTIKLENSKQLFFGPIYSLGLIKLEILKTFIIINLANNFIWSFKSLTGVAMLFD